MDFLRAHLLSIVTYTPLVGAAVLLLPLFKKNDDAVRWFANATRRGVTRADKRPAALLA